MEVFQRHGLQIQPGAMTTLLIGDQESVFAALGETFRCAAERGDAAMVVTICNACPLPINKKATQ
jgi:hypothetical protein